MPAVGCWCGGSWSLPHSSVPRRGVRVRDARDGPLTDAPTPRDQEPPHQHDGRHSPHSLIRYSRLLALASGRAAPVSIHTENTVEMRGGIRGRAQGTPGGLSLRVFDATEVGVPDLGVLEEFLRRALQDDSPRLHHVAPVRDARAMLRSVSTRRNRGAPVR